MPDGVDAALANLLMRSELGPQLSAADKAAMAARFKVTLREVQRWVTLAGEQRPFIPSGPAVGREALTEAEIADRIEWLRMVLRGAETDQESDAPRATSPWPGGDVVQAERFAREVAERRVDAWLSRSWERIALSVGKTGWEVRITYVRRSKSRYPDAELGEVRFPPLVSLRVRAPGGFTPRR